MLTLFLTTPISAHASDDSTNIQSGLERRDRAIHLLDDWIRDPYIVLGPDGWYYLTGTTANPGDPRNETERYNIGLDYQEQQLRNRPSIVGWKMKLWRSHDLIDWEYLGTPFTLLDGAWVRQDPDAFEGDRSKWRLWAPEIHFINGKWHVVHTTPAPVKGGSNLAVTKGATIEGPYTYPLGKKAMWRHDPSLFKDDDGTVYLLWDNTMVAPLNKDLSNFTAKPVRIEPSGSRPGPDGKPIQKIGHEGATIRKIGDKYVQFGTAWSTDRMRKGTYNLYYCVADSVTGPYGPRKFAGRFLGHGTPFVDRNGNWWCTAFFNANVPPITPEQAMEPTVGSTANTINPQGVTIVPLDVRVLNDGDIYIRAIPKEYATPGPEESQAFEQ